METPRPVTLDEAAALFAALNKRTRPAACASSGLYALTLGVADVERAKSTVAALVARGIREAHAVTLWDTRARTAEDVVAVTGEAGGAEEVARVLRMGRE